MSKSFVDEHLLGWAGSLFIGLAGDEVSDVYDALLAQAQTLAAANQVEDSVAAWVLHYQLSYGNLIPNLIVGGTIVLMLLCLLPTIKHAYRLLTKAKTD